MNQTDPTAAVWIDGDPLMEAIAAAVWEHCQTEGTMSLIVDDPRNIAAVAAAVARAAVRAAAFRDAEEICDEAGAVYTSKALNEQADAAYTLMERFRRKAEEAEAGASAVVSPPTDRAAVLREAIDVAREEGHRLEEVAGIEAARGARCVAYLLRKLLAKEGPRRLAVEAHDTGTQPQGDADATEADIDRMMAAGVPVQIVTRPPDTRGAGAQQQPGTEALTPRCDHCKQPGHSFEDCPRADEPAPVAQQPAALRAELKPWQLLADEPTEPLPQTERVIGGRRLDVTVDPAMCPRCKGDNSEAFELCTTCAQAEPQPAAADGEETRCAECPHPHAAHREGEDPVTPGVCVACPEDDAHHDYRPARETGASGC